MAAESSGTASVYKHETEAVQRPDVGVEAQFANKKTPKTYRYDSSLAPELAWDENDERDFAEWLLALIADAADKGEGRVPQSGVAGLSGPASSVRAESIKLPRRAG